MGALLAMAKAALNPQSCPPADADTGIRDEIERHLARLLPGRDHPDFSLALEVALRRPAEALETLRLSLPPTGA